MMFTMANLFMDVSQPPLILSAWSNRMNTQAVAASPTHSRSAKEKKAQGASRRFHEIGLPSARSHS